MKSYHESSGAPAPVPVPFAALRLLDCAEVPATAPEPASCAPEQADERDDIETALRGNIHRSTALLFDAATLLAAALALAEAAQSGGGFSRSEEDAREAGDDPMTTPASRLAALLQMAEPMVANAIRELS